MVIIPGRHPAGMPGPLLALLAIAAFAIHPAAIPYEEGPPLVCVEDGVVKVGASCDTVRKVRECVEMIVNSHSYQTWPLPVDQHVVDVRVPEPPSPSVCQPLLP